MWRAFQPIRMQKFSNLECCVDQVRNLAYKCASHFSQIFTSLKFLFFCNKAICFVIDLYCCSSWAWVLKSLAASKNYPRHCASGNELSIPIISRASFHRLEQLEHQFSSKSRQAPWCFWSLLEGWRCSPPVWWKSYDPPHPDEDSPEWLWGWWFDLCWSLSLQAWLFSLQ